MRFKVPGDTFRLHVDEQAEKAKDALDHVFDEFRTQSSSVTSLFCGSDTIAHTMKDNLVRFGVAMEQSLIEQLDALAELRGCNRSELLRDLTRAEVNRTALGDRVPAFAAVTLVYNHHVRELSERLTTLQHDLGEAVRSTMHVHLDHEHCLEVIVMRGRSDLLKEVTGRMIGTRGVLQGGAEYVVESSLALGSTGRRVHQHDGLEPHSHPPSHPHPHAHPEAHATHDHGKAKPKALRTSKKPRRKLSKLSGK